jgi:hypothetical protein
MKKIFILLVLLTIAACSSNDNDETGIAIITTEHYF